MEILFFSLLVMPDIGMSTPFITFQSLLIIKGFWLMIARFFLDWYHAWAASSCTSIYFSLHSILKDSQFVVSDSINWKSKVTSRWHSLEAKNDFWIVISQMTSRLYNIKVVFFLTIFRITLLTRSAIFHS